MAAATAAAPEEGAAPAAVAEEKTPEEIKKEQQKEAMLAMAAAAAAAAEAETKKKQKKGKGKKQKGSWDLLVPKDRQTRFWVEQFGRDSDAGNAEASKLQCLIDKKTEENKLAKENWEKEVKKMLKFLYQMDKKVDETRTNGCQSIVDLRQNVTDKKAKYERYWGDALSLDPYEELVVDHSIGRTLSFVVLAQIAQPWGQLSEKLEVASEELEQLTYFKDHGQYENEVQINKLESRVQSMLDDLSANHDFLEALMDKMKRRGLRRIARQADTAKHAAAQTLLTLLSPSDQEEIKNHAWFRAERHAYRRDEEITLKEIENMEEETLFLLKKVLGEEEDRLMGEVGGLEQEVEGLKEVLRKDRGGGGEEERGEGIKIVDDGTNSNLNYELSAKPSLLKSHSSGAINLMASDSKIVRFAEAQEDQEGGNGGGAEAAAVGGVGGGGGGGTAPSTAGRGRELIPIDERHEDEDGKKVTTTGLSDVTYSENQSQPVQSAESAEHDPYRPPCALPYDVPERLARMALEMNQACRANTTNIKNPEYVVDGASMPIDEAGFRMQSKKSTTSLSSENEFGGSKTKWPVSGKMLNSILPPWDPRKRPPKDEAPRDFRLANGREPWDPSLI